MQCQQCGKQTKRSSLCRDCKRAKEWQEQRPDILRELYPRRIIRELERIDIKINQSHLDLLKAGEEGLFLFGPTGVGKTLYACELMSQLVFPSVSKLRTRGFLFTTVERMLEDIKNSFSRQRGEGNPEETVDKYKNADYLLLDDFGPENLTDWVYSSLHGIINHRYDELLPTIITSNLDLNQVADRLGDDRITERIYEMCKLIYFDGNSQREGVE